MDAWLIAFAFRQRIVIGAPGPAILATQYPPVGSANQATGPACGLPGGGRRLQTAQLPAIDLTEGYMEAVNPPTIPV